MFYSCVEGMNMSYDFLPSLLLGYGMNNEIQVMAYRLFWNVVRQLIETIVYCGCGLS